MYPALAIKVSSCFVSPSFPPLCALALLLCPLAFRAARGTFGRRFGFPGLIPCCRCYRLCGAWFLPAGSRGDDAKNQQQQQQQPISLKRAPNSSGKTCEFLALILRCCCEVLVVYHHIIVSYQYSSVCCTESKECGKLRCCCCCGCGLSCGDDVET